MSKFLYALVSVLILCVSSTLMAVEFDANNDDIFDDQFKFDADNIVAGTIDAARLPADVVLKSEISGTPDGNKYLRDDYSWYTPAGSAHDPLTLAASAETVLSLSTQLMSLDTQTQYYVLMGNSGVAPTFQAITDAAIPDTITASNYLLLSLFDSYGIPYSDTDNTPAFLSVNTNSLIGRGGAGMTTFGIGTSANNIVQLNSSAELPAVSGVNLTNLAVASETVSGVVERATSAETVTGTDPTRYVSPDTLTDRLAAPGDIGGTTPGAATFTTVSAGAAGFVIDADGDATAKSLTIAKVSGTAGMLLLPEANSTDTDAAGYVGPLSLTASSSYAGRFPNAKASSNNMVLAWSTSGETGTGATDNPFVQPMAFVDLDNYLALAGGTMTGKLNTVASATGGAGFNLAHGAAPTSPTDGDFWTTTLGVYARINGGTIGPFGTSSADVTGGSVSTTGELAAYSDTTGKAIGRSYLNFTGPATSTKTKTISNAADTIAELGQQNNFSVPQTISAVNAASGSASAATLSGTAGIFNGSDTFRGLYLNYTNANHTGTGNTMALLDLAAITGDAEANLYGLRVGNLTGTTGSAGEVERAIEIGTGWDAGLYCQSPAVFTSTTTLLSSDADPSGAGAIKHDSVITGLTGGAMKYHNGTNARILVDLDTAPANDGYFLQYNLGAGKFVMTAGAGGLASGDIDTSSELRTIITDETGTGAIVFAGGDIAAATATTASSGDNDTSVATTAFVQDAARGSQTGSHASASTSTPLSPTWNSVMHTVWYNVAGTINLPAASGYSGRSILIYNTASYIITIDANGSEVIVRDGTAQTGGVSMTLSSGAGNYVALLCDGTRWVTLGYRGTLSLGS